MGSSIGIWMARLWKGEVCAVCMNGGKYETPWDLSPILGISKKLGFVFLREDNGRFVEYEPEISKEKYKRDFDVLVIHRNNLNQII